MMPWLMVLSSSWGGAPWTPFTFTVTVSTDPAPFGPSMTLVLSVLRSLVGPLCIGVGVLRPLSHGISVSSAPPRKSMFTGSGLGDVVPLRSLPLVVAAGVSVGRGKTEAGLATDTIRSRARR